METPPSSYHGLAVSVGHAEQAEDVTFIPVFVYLIKDQACLDVCGVAVFRHQRLRAEGAAEGQQRAAQGCSNRLHVLKALGRPGPPRKLFSAGAGGRLQSKPTKKAKA
ncbi:hypothetical protein NDU88_000923 [Pleurodeles waltl]|uniref:Uncharacterized protein n=1 Tax=Pleurodeles waltl TaxID=8319 RepID=A0AAV7LB99_PLEWA|nr:hypothetical protein NDU88_000923 [Pleurodeles waltl]